jgi:hypothetical protein
MSKTMSNARKKEIIAKMRLAHRLSMSDKFVNLSPYYILEGLDPKHRDKFSLNKYFKEWKNLPDTPENRNFFCWLAAAHPKFNEQQGVRYFSKHERFAHQINIDENGIVRIGKEKQPFDTTRYSGKSPGKAAYIMDSKGNIYVGEHKKNIIHHSSFNAGARVIAAGMLRVENGKITYIDHKSGHYAPTIMHFKNALERIHVEAFTDNASIVFTDPTPSRLLEFGKFLTEIKDNSYFTWLPIVFLLRLEQLGNYLQELATRESSVFSKDYYGKH